MALCAEIASWRYRGEDLAVSVHEMSDREHRCAGFAGSNSGMARQAFIAVEIDPVAFDRARYQRWLLGIIPDTSLGAVSRLRVCTKMLAISPQSVSEGAEPVRRPKMSVRRSTEIDLSGTSLTLSVLFLLVWGAGWPGHHLVDPDRKAVTSDSRDRESRYQYDGQQEEDERFRSKSSRRCSRSHDAHGQSRSETLATSTRMFEQSNNACDTHNTAA